MYDTLYAILNKSENATLKYFIFCEKVLDEKYLLKINNVFPDIQQTIRRNSTNLSLLMFELCSLLCLKLYSLNFAIASVPLVLTKKTNTYNYNVSDHKQQSYWEWKVAKSCLMLNAS